MLLSYRDEKFVSTRLRARVVDGAHAGRGRRAASATTRPNASPHGWPRSPTRRSAAWTCCCCSICCASRTTPNAGEPSSNRSSRTSTTWSCSATSSPPCRWCRRLPPMPTRRATPARRATAVSALERLAGGHLMEHMVGHLRTIDDGVFEHVKALCHALGAAGDPAAGRGAGRRRPRAGVPPAHRRARQLRQPRPRRGRAAQELAEPRRSAAPRSTCCAPLAATTRCRSWRRCSRTPTSTSSAKPFARL